MTKEEALVFWPVGMMDDLQDAYDERLYSFKTIIIGKVPFSKLYAAKVSQMRKLQAAFDVLVDLRDEEQRPSVQLLAFPENNLLEIARVYQANVMRLRQAVMMAPSFNALIALLDLLLTNMRTYAQFWPTDIELGDSEVKASQVMDEVALLKGLEALSSDGAKDIEAILQLNQDHVVYQEAIRLSLWRKLEANV